MQLLGPAIWDAVYSVEYATSWKIQVDLHRAMSCTIPDSTTRHLIWDVPDELSVEQGHDQHEPGPRQHNLSHGIRASTLINVCVAGIIMPVAGWRYGYSLLHRLSGVGAVLAISVLLASCSGVLIGVLTCSTHPKFRLFRRVLVLVVTQQCVLHPVQVFVQAVVCVGVLVGTYATSGSWSTSVLLAATSLATVMGGSHWVVRRRFVLTAATSSMPSSDQATVAVLGSMAVLLTYAVGLSLFVIYYHTADRIEVAFCLATLSGVVFVAASELCIMWAPTRAAGIVLQTRVTHCIRNWQLEPLRSFLECFVWLGVTYGTFVLYQDMVVALHLGTLSGIVVTLAGEVFRSRWWHPFPISGASGPPHESSVHQQRPKVLPLLLLFAYVGAGTFQWIFEHLRRLEVTVVLATVAGIVFLCVADVLAMWQPTRWAGVILQDRFLNASEHWQVHPVRSFVESGCFLGVIYGSHAIYGDLTVAVQCGTLSGMLVTLIGEQLKSRRRTNLLAHAPTISDKQILPFPIISVLGLVGCVAFNTIYTHLRNIEMAFVLATTSGVVFVVLGDVFVVWAPTRYVGLVVQERVLHFSRDLRSWSWRSYCELLLCTGALSASYCYLWAGDLLVAIQLCTFTAIVVCVVDDRIVRSIHEYEQTMVQQGQWHAQDKSDLLALPYDVLFEIARCLPPEELLGVRTTCHKINALLRAESKRFWLHATLRRQFGLTKARQATALNPYHRSLIMDAWAAMVSKLFAPRLEAHDAGFAVFRHIPDKVIAMLKCRDVTVLQVLLGIEVTKNAQYVTTRLTVPTRVYASLQADPFSFVVSETLYEVEGLSTWSLGTVVFVAMAVVCLGHATSGVALSLWGS
ncbi:hypothetical protein DYB31_011978 [Aphanomyces astaci]|uniref:F-box domain-containing protein n=1 Tax=Aphanomyces astaci TaxID=112090 RepID=A0A397EH75_APHAT|nr:hypothetical protein DYB31_011978 [Aphanomyces astaci]